MTSLSSISSRLLAAMHPRDRSTDPLSRLRFALETMPGSRKYVFTPATRAEILSELYDAFWGPYAHLFLPNSNSSLPLHAMLSEVQNSATSQKDPPVIPGRPCGHIFKRGEACFRCKDCALDDSCVLCSRCFEATDHSDHNVSFFIAQQSGGCCDCGDVEAWRSTIQCPYHPPKPEISDYLSAFALKTLQSTPRASARVMLGQDVPPVRDYPYRVSVPMELRDTMSRTVAYALDFILDTLDFSPDETSPPTTDDDLHAQLSGDPMMREQYSVVIWNDDKHSFDELIKLLCDVTNRSKEEATEAIDRLDDNGREVVEMNGNTVRLLELAQTLSQIDLGVTVRRAYDTFREQVAEVIIEWLLDLTRSRLGTDTLILREVIAAELLSPRKNYSLLPTHDTAKVLADIQDPSRMHWLFLYHVRLWKKPRLNLKEIYASLITLSHEHKLAIASHFASVYHKIIDLYLLVDREAETSIKYFALQLFTVPSVALYIVRQHNIISRLLSIITAFFTNQIQGKRIVYPPDPNVDIEVDAYPFKSKRFMPVFSDLRYLCHNESVQQLIAHNREYITHFSKTCQIFMCVNPNKRAATSHVEYEADAWISVFNVTLSLSRVIKVYGEAFSRATAAELVAAITTVMHHILMASAVADGQRDTTRFPPVLFHDVNFANRTYQVVKFDVMDGWVSFHHSLQWLLAELLKHVDILSEGSLREIGMSSLRDVCMRNVSEQAILTIVDYPLRVLAMIAQIRTGLWVRNGFAIRGQLMHYRDFMLRELCYDLDLFLLQTALVILDPNTVLISMLDRFQLTEYFQGATLHLVYESAQLPSMVEELLYVIITILTETANATKLSMPLAIRREIVHALAVGPCTFTDVTKRVAERLVDDAAFERVLKEVANFKPPESTADSGVYELKDEAYEEVNPFFYHYTRNKREDVETVLRNRLKKKTGVEDPVIVPKPMNITEGPFTTVSSAFESEVLLQIMFYGIYNILVITDAEGAAPPSSEAVLDQLVHLVMLAITERPSAFSGFTVGKHFEEDKNLLDILCVLEHHDKYKPYKARVGWTLDQIALHERDEVMKRRQIPEVAMDAVDPAEAKKRAAKARQEAIMRQMKAQQASFATNFEDIDDDEDEDMDGMPEAPISYGTCIVCQEELNHAKPFGSLGFLQPSRLLRRQPDGQHAYINEALLADDSLDRAEEHAVHTSFPPSVSLSTDYKARSTHSFEGFPAQYTRFGLHASICSHMMHLDCFTVYSGSIRQRHRAQATRNHPESIPRKEYICPLCKSLGNVILPVATDSTSTELNGLPFTEWTRAAGISILKSKADPVLESLQFRSGSGEFVFWAAQDTMYQTFVRIPDSPDNIEVHKMVDTVMIVSKNISQQSRHLRDHPEPEPGERGAGMYLPEELVGYTIASLEVAQRGMGSPGRIVADSLADSHYRMIRGLVTCLTKLVTLSFKHRPDQGRDAMRHAIIKRLLPEWSRGSLTSFTYPLLLRDPLTILVETAAVAPDMLRQVLILTYYACLARTVIGLVYILNKTRSHHVTSVAQRQYEHLFGDVRMFFISVVRHSPVFEQAGEMVFHSFGEARVEKLLYMFTLPFLRRAAILCRAMLPSAFPTPPASDDVCEYRRLLTMLDIPPLSDLPNQDTLQTALSVWCQHYGTSHAASQLNCGVILEYPCTYHLARLPLVLDHLYLDQEKIMTCARCKTVPLDAAICLICGTTCCMQSHCCMDVENGYRGECNMHTRECAGPVGIYFLAKRCCVLYLYANNGTFGQSPYLDSHGEVDISMRRGRRQFLHHARWEEVRRVWLNHGVPTLIARKLEGTVDSGGWETL
ncbi:uncharacterized protein LAESUDRAFT_723368 [Laetiporus sulphureus 93-53]|uniref:E3 ubiquitin-protein ligase n=1 Tax=Laetiporus sulphureus 93-53 TaxID=1314785 RepID=A0A165FJF6_9APHY|nr:uncharacterized protein LAESUDRAFT_723368 [Laetiporus sulphureus 93-53]KZT09063.1 hypothetical protein LAESUDRAFT_723368 [Laetiporus sulphureus 93-53]